jgi:Tfp pilus assembly protein PilX
MKSTGQSKQQGFALITALGVMVILMGVIGILVVSTVGDLQQSRSSLQLSQARAIAEAGIAVGHDALQGTGNTSLDTTLKATATTFFNSGSDPTTTWVIPQSSWATVTTSLENTLNNTAASNSISSSTLSNVGSAQITYKLSNFRGRVLSPTTTTPIQNYVLDYTITSTGSANGGTRTVTEQGTFTISMGRDSLNRYLFLVNDAGGQSGYFDSTSVFNGPVHANKNWGFSGNPTFTQEVTASNGTNADWSGSGMTTPTAAQQGIYYHCGGAPILSLATSRPGCSAPVYSQGFRYVAKPIALPTSALGQQRAALGLDPTTDVSPADGLPDAPTTFETCQKLRLSASCSPIVVPATGVYMPNDGSGNISGGMYIQGNVDSIKLDKPANKQQRYTLTQGATTTVILINYTTNTTTITKTPGGTTTYNGTPNGQAPVGTGGANGQIFVNGTVAALTGPARTGTVPANGPQHPVPTTIPPALAKETQLNITATGQVGITGDLTYECDPTRMANPAYITANPNCDTSGQPLKTVLGVMSTGSDVQIKATAPSDIYLWGSFYTAQPGQGLSVQNYNSRTPKDSGTMHLFGGLIQDQDQIRATGDGRGGVAGFREDYDYDPRFINGAVTPPNFPTTKTFKPNVGVPIPINFSEK